MLRLQLHGDNAEYLAALRLRWARGHCTSTDRRDTNYKESAHSSLGASSAAATAATADAAAAAAAALKVFGVIHGQA